jgi:hypothetical protein
MGKSFDARKTPKNGIFFSNLRRDVILVAWLMANKNNSRLEELIVD